MSPKRESLIQTQILSYLESRGDLMVWRNNTGKIDGVRFGLLGSADILGVLAGGRFLGIEVKSATGKQSPAQVRFQSRVEALGGLYILARSVDDVREALPLEGGRVLPRRRVYPGAFDDTVQR